MRDMNQIRKKATTCWEKKKSFDRSHQPAAKRTKKSDAMFSVHYQGTLKIAALAGRAGRRLKGGLASIGALTPGQRLHLAARGRRGAGILLRLPDPVSWSDDPPCACAAAPWEGRV